MSLPLDKDQIVTKSDKSQKLIRASGIGKTVTKSKKAQNPIVTKSD